MKTTSVACLGEVLRMQEFGEIQRLIGRIRHGPGLGHFESTSRGGGMPCEDNEKKAEF